MRPEQSQPVPPTFVEPAGDDHTGDRVATTILLFISGVIALGMAGAGLFLIFITDSCGSSSSCDTGSFSAAWIFSMAAPIAGFLATLVFAIVRLAKKKKAFWVPIAGTVLFGTLFAVGVVLAFQTVN